SDGSTDLISNFFNSIDPLQTSLHRSRLPAPLHVWMAPAWQEITSRAAQKSLAVMCPACSCSPDGLLALMGSANRGLIIRAGSMSRRTGRLLSVASERPTVPSRVITLSQATASAPGL